MMRELKRDGKQIRRIAAAMGLALLLTACGGDDSASKDRNIDISAAKSAALEAAGLEAAQAGDSAVSLEKRDGTEYYKVTFAAGDKNYEYAVDAMTGVVIEEKIVGAGESSADDAAGDGEVAETGETEAAESEAGGAPESAGDGVGGEGAAGGEAAVSGNGAGGVGTAGGEVSAVGNGAGGAGAAAGNGAGGAESASGTAGSAGAAPGNSAGTSSGDTELSAEDASAAALAKAGISKDDSSGLRVKRDMEDGRAVYDVEFFDQNGRKYEYEIDARTGGIRKASEEVHQSRQTAGGSMITEETARKVVLERVPQASADQIRMELDEDDGRMEYEGKLIHDGIEYEFKIDAYSGSLIEWESEIL